MSKISIFQISKFGPPLQQNFQAVIRKILRASELIPRASSDPKTKFFFRKRVYGGDLANAKNRLFRANFKYVPGVKIARPWPHFPPPFTGRKVGCGVDNFSKAEHAQIGPPKRKSRKKSIFSKCKNRPPKSAKNAFLGQNSPIFAFLAPK